jgi:hypothetical protein
MLPLLCATRSLGESNILPPDMLATVRPTFVTGSYSMTARGPWQAPSSLPVALTPRPLQPTSMSQISQVAAPPAPIVTLMMSPAVLFAVVALTKFE